MLIVLLFPLSLIPFSYQQSFTFPLNPQQTYSANYNDQSQQYNNVAYNSRFPYNTQTSNQQMNIQPRYSFNPVARVQVQSGYPGGYQYSNQSPLSPSYDARVSSNQMLSSPNEYQVDQRIPSSSFSTSSPLSQTSGPTRVIPSFLKTATIQEQDKFYEIVQHPTWSGIEKNNKIEELMRTMSEERQTMYTDYRRDNNRDMEEKRKNVDKVVSTMSKEAYEQFQKVVQIMHDPSQPEQQKLKKIEEIYSKLPDSIRKEFDVKLKGF